MTEKSTTTLALVQPDLSDLATFSEKIFDFSFFGFL